MRNLGVQTYDSERNTRSLNDVLGDLNTSMDSMTSAEKSNIIATIFNKTDLASVNVLLANTGDLKLLSECVKTVLSIEVKGTCFGA